jgi:hypothetical protein
MKPFAKNISFSGTGIKKDEIFDKFKETMVHTLPKALFVYLPIFAFFFGCFTIKRNGGILIMVFLHFIIFPFYC